MHQQAELQSAMCHAMPNLLGLQPVGGLDVRTRFDGGGFRRNGGGLLLREIERWVRIPFATRPMFKGQSHSRDRFAETPIRLERDIFASALAGC